MNYDDFLMSKTQRGANVGFAPLWIPDCAFDFQHKCIEWAIRKGRAALFEDCGLGKTLQQLVWAQNVVMHTNGRVLIFTPIAVSSQTAGEADKFGIRANVSRDGKITDGITITNYERLHYFNANDFVGVVCDESSILKNFAGTRRGEITEFMRHIQYRLLCTATAAPNDFTEMGTSSEALGYLGHLDMLAKFFKNDQGNSIKAMRSRRFETGEARDESGKWRFRGHAEIPFWRWVCSWAMALRKPSDIGCDDTPFVLPELIEREHIIAARNLPDGYLFDVPATGLREQREEARRTIAERCEMASSMVAETGNPAIVWCNLNDEGDLLEKLIPDCVQVSGKDSDEAKEDKFMAFSHGDARVLVTKHKIGAWGLNFQHCAHQVCFPLNSFEQYYQGIRRSYRFGQKRAVTIDVIGTEGSLNVLKNLNRKQLQAERMFTNLVNEMNNAISVKNITKFNQQETIPSWL